MKYFNNIKDYRLTKKMTQTQVAEYLGIAQTAYGKYELGEREASYDTLRKLSFLFDCSIDELLANTARAEQLSLSTREINHIGKYKQLEDSQREALDLIADEFIKKIPKINLQKEHIISVQKLRNGDSAITYLVKKNDDKN